MMSEASVENAEVTELTSITIKLADDNAKDKKEEKLKNPVSLPASHIGFVNDPPSDLYNNIKFWFLICSGVVLVRAIFFIFFLVCGGTCGVLASIGVPEDLSIPRPRWRKIVASPIMLFARMLLFCAGFHWVSFIQD